MADELKPTTKEEREEWKLRNIAVGDCQCSICQERRQTLRLIADRERISAHASEFIAALRSLPEGNAMRHALRFDSAKRLMEELDAD